MRSSLPRRRASTELCCVQHRSVVPSGTKHRLCTRGWMIRCWRRGWGMTADRITYLRSHPRGCEEIVVNAQPPLRRSPSLTSGVWTVAQIAFQAPPQVEDASGEKERPVAVLRADLQPVLGNGGLPRRPRLASRGLPAGSVGVLPGGRSPHHDPRLARRPRSLIERVGVGGGDLRRRRRCRNGSAVCGTCPRGKWESCLRSPPSSRAPFRCSWV